VLQLTLVWPHTSLATRTAPPTPEGSQPDQTHWLSRLLADEAPSSTLLEAALRHALATDLQMHNCVPDTQWLDVQQAWASGPANTTWCPSGLNRQSCPNPAQVSLCALSGTHSYIETGHVLQYHMPRTASTATIGMARPPSSTTKSPVTRQISLAVS